MSRILSKLLSFALMFTSPNVHAEPDAPQKGSAYDFAFKSIDGEPMPLKSFEGRVLLVVNTASFCGFTRQYKGLQALHEKYEARGLTVIGVPSNDFGGQEPKAEGEIKEFCEGAFGVTFPLTSKEQVKGAGAHPFYRWTLEQLGENASPAWNFHKYLVARDGRVVASLNSGVEPDSEELVSAVEAELAKKPAATN